MTNRVDDLAMKYQSGEDMPKLLTALDELDMTDLTDEELEAWFHLRGIVEFRLDNRADAKKYFQQGLEKFPTSGPILFSLGQEYEFEGDIDKMTDCFLKADISTVGPRLTLMMCRYFYIWDRPDEGLAKLLPIMAVYQELGQVDDMFLYMRGMPMYSESYGYFAVFAKMKGDNELANQVLNDDVERFSIPEVEGLQAQLKALFDGDTTEMEAIIAEDPENPDSMGPVWGLIRMKRAIFEARAAADYETARNVLVTVKQGDADFPWLEDIRLLGLVEAAWQRDHEDKDRLAQDFIDRQTLLFEPNIIFSFGMFEVQEWLKEVYRSSR